jgi:hypothetical protein
LQKFGSNKAYLTLGVKANVQLKSSIPIGAKVEISPKEFTLGVKAEIEKIFSICLKLLIRNAELYGFVLTPSLKKKDNMEFGKPICNPWDLCSSIY